MTTDDQHPSDESADTQSSQQGDNPFQTDELGNVPSMLNQTASSNQELKINSLVGPYKIIEKLGEGGFGVVYHAEQQEPIQMRVALKVIKPHLSQSLPKESNSELENRFQAERQALALLDHPGIAKILNAGTTPSNLHYFVMEFVEGEPITDYADRLKLNLKQRVELLIQVSNAIQHAHQKGIIHRDLKPSNILITEDDSKKPIVKIIDFGLVKAISGPLLGQSKIDESNRVLGTPLFMSPEQADPNNQDIDTRTDIYSLGVLAYLLLCGEEPFQREELTYKDLLKTLQNSQPQKPSHRVRKSPSWGEMPAKERSMSSKQLLKQLEEDLDWLVMKAMAKNRQNRYQSISELISDLHHFLNGEKIAARGKNLKYSLSKFISRNSFKIKATLTLLIIALGVWAVQLFLDSFEKNVRLNYLEDEWSMIVRPTKEKANEHKLALDQEILKSIQNNTVWHPVWEKQKELESWKQYSKASNEIEDGTDDLLLRVNEIYENSAKYSSARIRAKKLLEEIYYSIYKEAESLGYNKVKPDFYLRRLQKLGAQSNQNLFSGNGTISLSSTVPEARLYVFRIDEVETRRVPLPFNIQLGDVTQPILKVEKVYSESDIFRVDDVIYSIKDKEITTRTELGESLTGLKADEAINLKLKSKGGKVRSLAWIPFPSLKYKNQQLPTYLKAGKLLSIRKQLGIQFYGSPLEFKDINFLGTTVKDSKFEFSLPVGNYLLVAKKEGFRESRYPLVVKPNRIEFSIQLLADSVVPKGFIHIPEGNAEIGGDPEAFQSLPRDSKEIPSFLISKYEVSLGDWLEFINDPEVLIQTNIESGESKSPLRLSKDVIYTNENALSKSKVAEDAPSITLNPEHPHPGKAGSFTYTFSKEKKLWFIDPKSELMPNHPINGVSFIAVKEFLKWKTLRDQQGRTFRLPTDEEWEKAARGKDRRSYPWGNYLIWDFCSSRSSHPLHIYKGTEYPLSEYVDLIGSYPSDESIYAVRDMAGSVMEWTSGKTKPGYKFQSYRGGGYEQVDEYMFRCATRNGLYPNQSKYDLGFRMVITIDTPLHSKDRSTHPQ